MGIERLGRAAAVAIGLAVTGCGGGGKDSDTTSLAAEKTEREVETTSITTSSGFRWRRDTYRELDGDDENAERLIATVSGSRVDSMVVRLEIRTSKDGLLYRHEWPAPSYMKYLGAGSAKDTARVLRETQRQLGLLFADSQFISGAAAVRYAGKREPDADAIRYDLAERQYLTSKGLNRWSAIKGPAWDEVNALAKTIPNARVNAIVAETRDNPAFRYYAGGEETYVVAWSPTEQRMVRIAACC